MNLWLPPLSAYSSILKIVVSLNFRGLVIHLCSKLTTGQRRNIVFSTELIALYPPNSRWQQMINIQTTEFFSSINDILNLEAFEENIYSMSGYIDTSAESVCSNNI